VEGDSEDAADAAALPEADAESDARDALGWGLAEADALGALALVRALPLPPRLAAADGEGAEADAEGDERVLLLPPRLAAADCEGAEADAVSDAREAVAAADALPAASVPDGEPLAAPDALCGPGVALPPPLAVIRVLAAGVIDRVSVALLDAVALDDALVIGEPVAAALAEAALALAHALNSPVALAPPESDAAADADADSDALAEARGESVERCVEAAVALETRETVAALPLAFPDALAVGPPRVPDCVIVAARVGSGVRLAATLPLRALDGVAARGGDAVVATERELSAVADCDVLKDPVAGADAETAGEFVCEADARPDADAEFAGGVGVGVGCALRESELAADTLPRAERDALGDREPLADPEGERLTAGERDNEPDVE